MNNIQFVEEKIYPIKLVCIEIRNFSAFRDAAAPKADNS